MSNNKYKLNKNLVQILKNKIFNKYYKYKRSINCKKNRNNYDNNEYIPTKNIKKR